LVLKKWQLSHISFVLALFSKLLSAVFLPLTIFFVLSNTKGKKRIYLLIFYIILIIAGLFAVSNLFDDANITYLPENFIKGFVQFNYQLRFDPIILIFLLPLTVALFLKSLKGLHQAKSIQVLISGFLLVPPLLITFTEQTNEPYRLIPLVVFFAIGVSALLGKIKQDEP
jgi:high-affinity Fe2+/Pb2+ permease